MVEKPGAASDEELDQRVQTMSDTYWGVCRTPASQIRHVAEKLRVARTQMDGSGDWVDGRVELMLASALVDLERGGFDP